MIDFETVVLMLIVLLSVYSALDNRIDTSGVLRTVALGTMALGGLLALGCGKHDLVEFGVVLCLMDKLVYTRAKINSRSVRG